ncbi:hypothetical protein [Novacetimonas maltaceti]|nr:hypothetical protein [Novacetimonas maltaceti]
MSHALWAKSPAPATLDAATSVVVTLAPVRGDGAGTETLMR